MLNIGGQTVRLATPGGTLLKAGSTLTGKELLIFHFYRIDCKIIIYLFRQYIRNKCCDLAIKIC